jgi:Holliday junction resolvasome RuvABC DNA-binding subunit
LRALGYTLAEAQAAAAQVTAGPEVPVEERVVAALRELGQR